MNHTEALFKTIILLHHLAELHKKDNVNLYYIDLFCGAGGTSTGVEQANIGSSSIAKVIACVNHDKNAIASHMLTILTPSISRRICVRLIWHRSLI